MLRDQLWLQTCVQSRPDDFKMKSPSTIFACANRLSLPAHRFPGCSNTASILKAASSTQPSAEFHYRFLAADVCFPSFRRLHFQRRRDWIDADTPKWVYWNIQFAIFFERFANKMLISNNKLFPRLAFRLATKVLAFRFYFSRRVIPVSSSMTTKTNVYKYRS